MLRTLAAGLALWALPALAAAQEVAGRAVDAVDARPLPGALVLLRDSAGTMHARTFTSASGEYRLRGPRAGSFLLTIEYVGYASPPPRSVQLRPDARAQESFELKPAALSLAALEVNAGTRGCSRIEEASGTQALWEEARKALESALLAEQNAMIRFTMQRYRLETASDGTILSESMHALKNIHGSTTFKVAEPAELHSEGWFRRTPQGNVHYGPDARTLLSPEFLESHCFSARRDADGKRAGLTFRPHPRSKVTDISGTIWLDAATAALERVDYTYANLPQPYDAYPATGTVEFRRLDNGAWIISAWRIAMPLLRADMALGRNAVGRYGTLEEGATVVDAVPVRTGGTGSP